MLIVVGRFPMVDWVDVGTMTTKEVDTPGADDVTLVLGVGAPVPVLEAGGVDVL